MLQSVRAWVEWLDALPSSVAIRESLNGYPALLTFHVVSMAFFAGLIIMMDLRLLGVGNRRTPFSQVQRSLFPAQMIGMVAASASGLALAYGQPTRFFDNFFFWIKMVMVLLTGVNAIVFHYATYDSVAQWDTNPALLPARAKFAAVISLILWGGVITSGRLMAYAEQWFPL
jgi:hypothetical protein